MRKYFGIAIAGAAIIAGSIFGYKLATDKELRGRLTRGARDAFDTSKKKVDEMSEEVALRTAQLTKNPQVNQEWVEHQWDLI